MSIMIPARLLRPPGRRALFPVDPADLERSRHQAHRLVVVTTVTGRRGGRRIRGRLVGVGVSKSRHEKGETMSAKLVAIAGAVTLIAVANASGALGKQGNSLHATLSGKVEVPKGDPDG